MRKLKKAFSLTLALALSLALAVPAFADSAKNYSANGYTDPAAENVEFSVAPIGVAKIRWVSPWYTEEYTAYVFDQDCAVTRKDGLPFKYFGLPPMYGDMGYTVSMGSFEQWASTEKEWAWVEAGSAGIRADSDKGLVLNFAPDYTSEGELDWSPYMMSKKSLDTVFPYEFEYEEGVTTGTVLEYRSLSAQPTEPTTPVEPEQPTQPVTPDAPGTYTVKKGDTWSSICTNFYGTNGQRYELMKANKGVALKEGAVITLPEKLGKDTLIPAAVAGEGEKLYTVKLGDTLGKIAAAEYGKASEYKAIFERNADRLKNANTIYEGQVIVLPAKK